MVFSTEDYERDKGSDRADCMKKKRTVENQKPGRSSSTAIEIYLKKNYRRKRKSTDLEGVDFRGEETGKRDSRRH